MSTIELASYETVSNKQVLTKYLRKTSTSTKTASGNIDRFAVNPYSLRKTDRQSATSIIGRYNTFNGPHIDPQFTGLADCPGYNAIDASLQNELLAKFSGKLKDGSASLGMALATYKGTRDMITSRMMRVSETLDDVLAFLRGNPQALARIRKRRQPLAGQFLEYEFGWVPLMQDIEAAYTTVIQMGAINGFTRSAGKRAVVGINSLYGGAYTTEFEGIVKMSYSAQITISNPNLWLAERAGFINWAAVAWDAVPWSFVVNMFANTGQIIGSLTDRFGLTVSNQSFTRKQLYFLKVHRDDAYFGTTYDGTYFNVWQDRMKDVKPTLSLEFKIPELSWELAAIAAALVVQKFSRINKLVRLI